MMKNEYSISRRTAVKSSILGLLAVSIPNIMYAKKVLKRVDAPVKPEGLPLRYPSIDDAIVASVVGAAHFNLDKVKDLVNHRPELARATWDWSFGDWETAIGAASHVGRRDIVAFLMSRGARPDIFTYGMLGNYEAVKAMIEATPGVQSIDGPHGISLLQHAKGGRRAENLSDIQKSNSDKLIDYLEHLGNADKNVDDIPIDAAAQEKFLGDYMYGDGPTDGLSVKLNMRDRLCLGKLGAFGGGLHQKAINRFTYNGISSVEISFEVVDGKVLSLTIQEPDLTLRAMKV